jgi:hypothetical protein
MSLWERLAESRKKQKIENYADGGEVTDALFVDFKEMEDQAEAAIKEYLSRPLDKIDRELELKVCQGIVKYLLINFGRLENCGELAISENLGIPRSRLRKLLANMEWNGIVECIDVGKSAPYVVANVSKAMKEGYLALSEVELEKLVKISHSMGLEAPYRDPRSLLVEAIQSTLPNPEVFIEAFIRSAKIYGNQMPPAEQVHRPFNPATVTTYHTGFNDFQLVQKYLTWPFYGELLRDLLLELGVPDEVTDEELQNGLRKLGEKYLRLIELSLRPLYDEVSKLGFIEARKKIEKGLLRDRLLEMESPLSADIYWGERLLEKRRILPRHGLVTLQTEELTPSHVRLAANILLAACRFAEFVRVDSSRVNDCSRKARALIQAVQDLS